MAGPLSLSAQIRVVQAAQAALAPQSTTRPAERALMARQLDSVVATLLALEPHEAAVRETVRMERERTRQ